MGLKAAFTHPISFLGLSRSKRKFYRSFDIFGHSYQYKLPQFRSTLGSTLSLTVVLIFLTFIGTTLERFVNSPLEIITFGEQSDYGRMAVPPFAIALRHQTHSESAAQNTLNDTLFHVEFAQYIIRQQDQLPRTKTVLNFTSDCSDNVGEFANTFSDMVYCLTDSAFMEGDYNQNEYHYLQVKLSGCVLDEGCRPWNESLSIIKDSTINFVILETKPGRSMGEVLEVSTPVHWWFNSNLFGSTDIYVKRTYTHWRPRFLFECVFTECSQTTVTVEKGDTMFRDFSEAEGILGKWYFRLAFEEEYQYHSGQTILDLFSSWGAFWTFMFTFFIGRFAVQYNKGRAEQQIYAVCARYHLEPRLLSRLDFDDFGRFTPEALARYEQNRADGITAPRLPCSGNKAEMHDAFVDLGPAYAFDELTGTDPSTPYAFGSVVEDQGDVQGPNAVDALEHHDNASADLSSSPSHPSEPLQQHL